MNNYERIKIMTIDEMAELFENKNFSCKICKEVMREKCSQQCLMNVTQWLWEETTMKPPKITFTEFLQGMIVVFFMALGMGYVIEKLYYNFW